MNRPLWQMIQISGVLDLELGSALSESVDVLAWKPQRTFFPHFTKPGAEQEQPYIDSLFPAMHGGTFRIRRLPLLHGFARRPLCWLAPMTPLVMERLLLQTATPEESPLICSAPFFAPVAERWPGPVVYWLTDMIAEYASANRRQVMRLDRRMCRVATLVCPNSARLAGYLLREACCDAAKIHIIPNATRAANVLSEPPTSPGPRPATLAGIRGPIAGVIGNLASNMDWILLQRVVHLTPWLTWVFVGPTSMQIADGAARRARHALMHHPNARFVGRQPYGSLAQYARCFEVAFLPYRYCEPTCSGSSTRFYEHLAACRPMISTRALEEFTHKEPLLSLIDTADDAVRALEQLRMQHFHDGLVELRWSVSRHGTWQERAESMRQALSERAPAMAHLSHSPTTRTSSVHGAAAS